MCILYGAFCKFLARWPVAWQDNFVSRCIAVYACCMALVSVYCALIICCMEWSHCSLVFICCVKSCGFTISRIIRRVYLILNLPHTFNGMKSETLHGWKTALSPWSSHCIGNLTLALVSELRLSHVLSHWGRVTHICVIKLTIVGSDNGLSPGRRQAIIWTNAGLLLIGPLGTNFSEILIFSFKKMRLKVSSAKRRPFCLGFNVLTGWPRSIIRRYQMSILHDEFCVKMTVLYRWNKL